MGKFLDRFKRDKSKRYTREGIEILSFSDWKKDIERDLKEIGKPLPVCDFWDESKHYPQPRFAQRIREVIKPPKPEPMEPTKTTARAETAPTPKPKPEGLLRNIIRRLTG